jgi:hypothetical protein
MNEQTIIELIKQWVSIPYLLTFVFLSYGFFKKTNIKFIEIQKWEWKIPKTWLVAIFAFILAIPFYFLESGESNIILMKLIISYSIGTSFYELIVKQIDKFVAKK